MYLMDYYTIPGSLAGLPSLSVPCGGAVPEDGSCPMPMGLQLTTPLFTDARCLGTRTPTNAQRCTPKNSVMSP